MFSLFHRASLADHARQMHLSGYRPSVQLRDLILGVDNLRHDVFLSPKFTEVARAHISVLISYHGAVHDLLAPESSDPLRRLAPSWAATPQRPSETAAEFKKKTLELEVGGLNLARRQGNLYQDLLLRLAVIKFLREELNAQYTQTLERCRSKLRALDGPAHSSFGLQTRERFLQFQLNKRSVLRKCGEDLYETLRQIEKETVAPMRRSMFAESESSSYDLFLNRLIFTDNGRDDFLKARHYVMLGNYERDADRLPVLQELARNFLRGLLPAGSFSSEEELDGFLNVPENAQELTGAGAPPEATEKGNSQRAVLAAWVEALETAAVMELVLAAYEVVPLLAEYSPLINPQQLKNALISRSERARVEELLAAHGKISPANFQTALKRISTYERAERAKVAGRFMADFLRYNRDVRRLEALNAAIDQVNLITTERMRQLSAVNSTLYEYQLPDEQKAADQRVLSHVILKADVRDSTRLTRTLTERGQNPASYFSLGFYDPVSKLLSKYGASKVFIEGDAIILALQTRENETAFSVARACALGREITAIVQAFHRQSNSLQLPALELGIGICYQDSAPMYLLDGSSQIMISDALNLADRLSACQRRTRKHLQERNLPFHVFSFQVPEAQLGAREEVSLQYNVGGIQLSLSAFQQLRREISLQNFELAFPGIWGEERVTLYRGVVPVTADVFQTIVVREAVAALVDVRDLSFLGWTDRSYYEVCTSEEPIARVEQAYTRATAG
ncbi:MAG: hypothetical protein ABSD88_06370 [Candidatus Korobacteraceae bacterium]